LRDKVKVVCPDCGATNNFPIDHKGKKVVCGRCKSILPEPGTVIEPLPNQIVNLLQSSHIPVLSSICDPGRPDIRHCV